MLAARGLRGRPLRRVRRCDVYLPALPFLQQRAWAIVKGGAASVAVVAEPQGLQPVPSAEGVHELVKGQERAAQLVGRDEKPNPTMPNSLEPLDDLL